MTDTYTPRTVWAEAHVENFIAPAFVAEFVFRSPQVIDATQKEVADLLIHRGEHGLIVSQKCQDDPTSRSGQKLHCWAHKKAQEAASQLKGALRRVGGPDKIWCQHWRRGRVDFPDGLPNITHAVATVEVFEQVVLKNELPLEHEGTPISYLSVSDFLNVCNELRSVPEVIRYLNVRRLLPKHALLTIGAERLIFSHYLLHDGSFAGFKSIAETSRILCESESEFLRLVEAKADRDRYAVSLEHVADQLAGRDPSYAEGLTQDILDRYEPTGERHKYLLMQDVIAGLYLGERAELGRVFVNAIRERKEQGGGVVFAAAMASSHPDLVFVLGSFGATKTFARQHLLASFDPLTRAAMAYYGCKRSLIIVDRDGQSYEVGYNEQTAAPTPGELEAGRNVFGRLKTFDKQIRIRPETGTR